MEDLNSENLERKGKGKKTEKKGFVGMYIWVGNCDDFRA
jgi:hypothetical protein